MRTGKLALRSGLLCGILAISFLALAALLLRIGGRMYLQSRPLYYQTITIDMQTMRASLSEPFPERDHNTPPRADYYSTFQSMADLGIYHYDGAKNLPFRVRYNYFSADNNYRLRGRAKLQELSSGVYGTVYAETHYSYWKAKGSSFRVMLYANKAEHEPPQVIDAMPNPAPQVSAVSLVRVVRTWPEFSVVIATYDMQGKRQGVSVFWSKGGEWRHQADVPEEKREFTARKEPVETIYGIPDQFPIADYLKDPYLDWKDLERPNPENVVNVHYDYNRWVRQDVFDAAGFRTTRYLTYVVTPEDKILEPLDRQLPFGQHQRE
jgi:hypothetical protein